MTISANAKTWVKNKGQKINLSVKYQIKTFLYVLYTISILYFQVRKFQSVLMNRSYRIYIKNRLIYYVETVRSDISKDDDDEKF